MSKQARSDTHGQMPSDGFTCGTLVFYLLILFICAVGVAMAFGAIT